MGDFRFNEFPSPHILLDALRTPDNMSTRDKSPRAAGALSPFVKGGVGDFRCTPALVPEFQPSLWPEGQQWRGGPDLQVVRKALARGLRNL